MSLRKYAESLSNIKDMNPALTVGQNKFYFWKLVPYLLGLEYVECIP